MFSSKVWRRSSSTGNINLRCIAEMRVVMQCQYLRCASRCGTLQPFFALFAVKALNRQGRKVGAKNAKKEMWNQSGVKWSCVMRALNSREVNHIKPAGKLNSVVWNCAFLASYAGDWGCIAGLRRSNPPKCYRRPLQPSEQHAASGLYLDSSGIKMERTESGTLWLKKPGKMRWEYRSPKEKLFLGDGQRCLVFTFPAMVRCGSSFYAQTGRSAVAAGLAFRASTTREGVTRDYLSLQMWRRWFLATSCEGHPLAMADRISRFAS